MTDNTTYTPGSGATIAADDIGGVLFQRVKLSLGADGSASDVALGQTTMANAMPVAIASDQFGAVSTASASSATTLLTVDCLGAAGVSVQITTTTLSGTILWEGSNDNATWGNVNGFALNQGSSVLLSVGSPSAGSFYFIPAHSRYIRFRVSSYTSGSITIYAALKTVQPGIPTVAVYSGSSVQLAASSNLIGDVGVQYRANSTGGASTKTEISVASTAFSQAKASAGRLLGWSFGNTSASWRYIKWCNTASPTPGTTVPVMVTPLPPGATVSQTLDGGIAFSSAITYFITAGAALLDTTAGGAGDVVGTCFYA